MKMPVAKKSSTSACQHKLKGNWSCLAFLLLWNNITWGECSEIIASIMCCALQNLIISGDFFSSLDVLPTEALEV